MHKSSLVPCWFTGRLISRSMRGLYALTIRFGKRNTRSGPVRSNHRDYALGVYPRNRRSRPRYIPIVRMASKKCPKRLSCSIMYFIHKTGRHATLALTFLVALATECFIVPIECPSDQTRDINNHVADTTSNISHYSI